MPLVICKLYAYLMWCFVYARLLIRVSPYVDYLIDGALGGLSWRRLADEPIGSARVGLRHPLWVPIPVEDAPFV